MPRLNPRCRTSIERSPCRVEKDAAGEVVSLPFPATSEPLANSLPREGAKADTAEHRAALRLWLHWHDAHMQLTTQLYEHRHDRRKIEMLLDAAERLRRQAVAATSALLAG